MQTDSQKPSIWRRLATIMSEMDGALHPADYYSERLASLEARVKRIEAACPGIKKPD